MIYLDLFWRFALISLLAFGGGQAALPLVERMAVHDARWITPTMFGAALALAYVTPGPVLIVSTFVGYQVAGIAGALVAALGAFLAPWGLAALLARQLGRLAQHPTVRRFGRAAAPAAIALLGVTILDLGRVGSWSHWAIALLVLVAATSTRVNPAASSAIRLHTETLRQSQAALRQRLNQAETLRGHTRFGGQRLERVRRTVA